MYKYKDLENREETERLPIIVDVVGFEKLYEVCTDGSIYNAQTGQEIKPCVDGCGYHVVNLYKNKKMYTKKIHRIVAEAFLENLYDKEQVDHIDNDRTNNNVYNLRWATTQENSFNKQLSKKNTSNIKGVFYNKKAKKWHAQIRVNGKCIYLGLFDDIEDAKIARQNKAIIVFGDFINICEK